MNVKRLNKSAFFLAGTFLAGAFLAGTALAQTNVDAEAPVNISGVALEYRLRENGNDQYNKLLETLADKKLKFNLVIFPLTRAVRNLMDGQDCIFPSSLNSIQTHFSEQTKGREFIASNPIDYISMRVFTRQGEKTIASFNELNDKRVAIWLGFDRNIYLQGINATVDEVASEEVRVNMLTKKRVDAIVGFTPDVFFAAQKLGVPIPEYNKSLAVFEGEGASVVCHKNDKNIRFIEQLNVQLELLRESGELGKILGPYATLVH
uniref:substrate-binding periplasmic protein n=1 Tax=Cellvibrio fontiphilus TaxID=1815559 RepID=UPI002B4C13D8|nr:transporter substrate-binding domain-containing protein [Cellvibrio fontiphilus]